MLISTIIPEIDSFSEENISSVVDLINRVYLDSEKDFWPHNGDYSRTDIAEVKEFVKNNELIIAKLKGEIVGAVRVYTVNENTGGFGMLVSSPEMRGSKIGSQLMIAIEEWFLNRKLKQIQIEILKPTESIHPEKDFIEQWYKRLGYKLISVKPYGKLYPVNQHLLRIPCDFYIYNKELN